MGLSRGATPGLLSALSGHFHPILLAYTEWPGETIRVHTGAGPITWGGNTWAGVGKFVSFTAGADVQGLAADTATISVAGTLEAVLAERGKVIRSTLLTLWLGVAETVEGLALKSGVEPCILYVGAFDGRRFRAARDGDLGDLTHELMLDLVNGPAARALVVTQHSPEDQERRHPGDTGMRHASRRCHFATSCRPAPRAFMRAGRTLHR